MKKTGKKLFFLFVVTTIFTFCIRVNASDRKVYALSSIHHKNTGSLITVNTQQGNDAADFTPAYDHENTLAGICVITFKLNDPGFVNIKIYDEFGNTLDEIARSSFSAGLHTVKWNRTKFSSRVIYYSIITKEFSETRKIK